MEIRICPGETNPVISHLNQGYAGRLAGYIIRHRRRLDPGFHLSHMPGPLVSTQAASALSSIV